MFTKTEHKLTQSLLSNPPVRRIHSARLQAGKKKVKTGNQVDAIASATLDYVDERLVQTKKYGAYLSQEKHVSVTDSIPDLPRFKEDDSLITMKQVMEITGTSDKFIYAQLQKGLFPQQLKFGRASRWILREVYGYINERAKSGSKQKK